MTSRPSCSAGLRVGASSLALAALIAAAAAPSWAQSEGQPASAAAAEPATPAAPVSPAAVEPASPPPSTAPPAAASPALASAPAEVDPIILAVRERLAASARAGQDRDDRQALAVFYRDRAAPPLWVTSAGLTSAGTAVIGEITTADDWGLQATAFELPDPRSAGAGAATQRADDEIRIGLAVLKYARHARGGRLEPAQLSRNFDQKPPVKAPAAVLQEIAAAKAPDEYLRKLHPQHPQFEKLRQALLAARAGKTAPAAALKPGDPDPTVKLADGPSVKVGQKHAAVADLRRRLGVPAPDADKAEVLDAKLAEALKTYQREHDLSASGTLDKATRTALNRVSKPASGSELQRILANLERWRWLPEDMGAFHVWDNVPEYQARVIRKGEIIHQARIIVGKPETQTPLFSADMRYVVFQPGWGVPDSIKVKEILPYLRKDTGFFGAFGSTDTSVLRKHNLTVNLNGRPVDASSINWQSVDIRQYSFVQPPGPSNVLGAVKFRFPNKHDVYMHDTSQRELFARGQRTYSHGCVRVDNPRRLAEILLEHDRGMPASEVGRLMTTGPKDNQIELKAKIPVHITYFTAVGQDDGTIKFHHDIYGHDARVTAALAGKPMAMEPDAAQVARAARPARPVKEAAAKSQGFDFFSGLFGN